MFGPYDTSTVPGSCWRPYASSSPFNRAVPANPPLYSDAGRNTSSAKLTGWGKGQSLIAGRTGREDWWHPLYYSRITDPLYTIRCTQWTSSCEIEGRQVRIPVGAKPAGGGDGHLTVIDQLTGTEYDMWQAATPSGSGGTLNISHGGVTQLDGDGLGSNATAAHFGISNQDAPPMGARPWLDYTPAQIDAMNLPAWKKVILKAMNAYGIIIGDTNGGSQSWGIQAESEQSHASYGRTSYWKTLGQQTGAGSYGGGYIFDLMSGVDWANHLHVLDPRISQGTCR